MVKEEPIDKTLFLMQKVLKDLESHLYSLVNIKDLVSAEAGIADLENKVEDFAKNTQALLLEAGLSKEDLKNFEAGIIPEGATEEMKDCLGKIHELKSFCMHLKSISDEERGIITENNQDPKQFKKLSKREHMRKYKHIGETEDRKPV